MAALCFNGATARPLEGLAATFPPDFGGARVAGGAMGAADRVGAADGVGEKWLRWLRASTVFLSSFDTIVALTKPAPGRPRVFLGIYAGPVLNPPSSPAPGNGHREGCIILGPP